MAVWLLYTYQSNLLIVVARRPHEKTVQAQ